MTISYVCLSDLHLGAPNSLLTNLCAQPNNQGQYEVDPTGPSPVLEALFVALRKQLDDPADPPQLILLGDVLELALAPDNVAIQAFVQFLRLAYAGPRPLFSPKILYLPGNHDHHIWEGAREDQYVAYLATVQNPAESWHSTHMFLGAAPVRSALLDAVVHLAGLELTIEVVYPNLGLGPADRRIVLHHGHFVEPLYTAMTEVRKVVFPRQPLPEQAWDIEAENWAWLEFVWSGVGRSGKVGTDIGVAYDMMQDRAARRALALGAFERMPLPGWWSWLRKAPLGWAMRRVLGRELEGPERFRTKQPLSPSAKAGLRSYIAGPVVKQIRRERAADGAPTKLTFVFGHTHKPFDGQVQVDGLPAPVRAVNTGGWVVDTAAKAAGHGASIILIDDQFDVTPLDWFRLNDDGSVAPTELQAALEPAVALRRDAVAARIKGGIDEVS